MKKFLTKIAFYTFLILLIGNVTAYLSLYVLGKSQLYKNQFVKNGVAATQFDYVVLGSSTGLTTLDTKLIDEKMHTSGLNISMDDTSLSSHYLMLQYFLSLGKKTNKLVLCVTPGDIQNPKVELNNNDYRFLTEVQDSLVYNYYNRLEDKGLKVLAYSKFFPILGVSYYNNELFYPSFYAFLKPNKRNRFDDKGNYTYPQITNNISKVGFATSKTNFVNPSFLKIKKLCQQKGIELIVYQSPIYRAKVVFPTTNEFKIINHSEILPEDLFYDNIHVNSKGRTFCTLAFCEEMKLLK
ncbi:MULTISPECIES: hypothetical protein [unclassified Flavobacterium]|uniref:hypothetical protein n=1 Tax=unclassified Flavobacterium TaxID=196869 RepID=UPI0012908C43|nr:MULTISPECIES: hypothetical protein [unclassified Flavobacterium]MQP52015.1 hypothetical protein [Flavobacterium sp. LMO9]MQP61884.1 hypothetical protein [Flavobacterium sp. LMO6]